MSIPTLTRAERAAESIPASLRMASAVLESVATFLAESGCPLTAEQRAAFDDAQDRLSKQVTA